MATRLDVNLVAQALGARREKKTKFLPTNVRDSETPSETKIRELPQIGSGETRRPRPGQNPTIAPTMMTSMG